MKKYVKLFENMEPEPIDPEREARRAERRKGMRRMFGNNVNPDVYAAVVETPYDFRVIAMTTDPEEAKRISDRFHEVFIDNLTFDHSQHAFDLFRSDYLDADRLANIFRWELDHDYESLGDLIEDLLDRTTIMFEDEDYAIALAEETNEEMSQEEDEEE